MNQNKGEKYKSVMKVGKVEQVNQVDGLWILNLKASGKMQPGTSQNKEDFFLLQIMTDSEETNMQSSTLPP